MAHKELKFTEDARRALDDLDKGEVRGRAILVP